MLSVNKLIGGRGEKSLFGPLTFNVKAGSLLWIQGSNGRGKTTLLKILASLLNPLSGYVAWENKKISYLDSDYLSQVVYLGHESGLQGLLTPLEYLKIALIQSRGLALDNKGLSDILQKAELQTVSQKLCGALSKGQQQRLNLARCLIQPGLCWLMDEPLSALDQKGQAWSEKLMIEHLQKDGIIVVTSHIPLTGICSHIPHQILVL